MKTIEKYLYVAVLWMVETIQKLKRYVEWGDMEKKHFILQKEGGQIRLTVKGHDDFVKDVQKKIDAYKGKGNEKKYIEFALREAMGGCIYIGFSKGEKFVQFWTNRGKIDFDFPVNKRNGFQKYYYAVIGLLSEMDFVKEGLVPSKSLTLDGFSNSNIYKVEGEVDLKMVKGYFKKRVEAAVEFTMRMFDEIYKTKKGKMKIWVG